MHACMLCCDPAQGHRQTPEISMVSSAAPSGRTTVSTLSCAASAPRQLGPRQSALSASLPATGEGLARSRDRPLQLICPLLRASPVQQVQTIAADARHFPLTARRQKSSEHGMLGRPPPPLATSSCSAIHLSGTSCSMACIQGHAVQRVSAQRSACRTTGVQQRPDLAMQRSVLRLASPTMQSKTSAGTWLV